MAFQDTLVDSIVTIKIAEGQFEKVKKQLKKICKLAEEINKKPIIPKLKLPKAGKGGGLGGSSGGGGPLGGVLPQLRDQAKAVQAELSRVATRARTAFGPLAQETRAVNVRLEEFKRKMREAFASGDNDAVSALISQMDAYRKSIKNTADSIKGVVSQNKAQAVNAKKAAQAQRAQNAAAAKSLAGLRKAAIQASREVINTLGKSITRSVLQTRIEADRLGFALRNLAQLRLNKLLNEVDRLKTEARSGRISVDQLRAGLNRLKRETDTAGVLVRIAAGLKVIAGVAATAARAIARVLTPAIRGLVGVAGLAILPLQSFFTQLRRFIQFAPTTFGFAVQGGLQEAVKNFSDFTFALAQARTELNLFGASGDSQIARISKTIVDVGKVTLSTQKEIALAVRELGKSGVVAEDVTSGLLKNIANFGLTASLSLNKAASTSVAVSRQFGKSLDQVNEVNNALVKAASLAPGTEVADLSRGLANVAATARLAGVSLEEVLTLFTGFRDANQGLSQAGTTFTTTVTRIQNAIRNQTKLGIELQDAIRQSAEKTGVAFDDIFAGRRFKEGGIFNLIEAGDEATRVGDAIRDIAGIRGFRFSGLFPQLDEMRKRYEVIADTTDVIADRAKELEKSLEGQRRLLKSASDALRTFTFSKFEGDLTGVTRLLRRFVNALQEQLQFSEVIDRIRDGFMSFAELIRPAAIQFAKFSAAINTIGFAAINGFARDLLPRIERLLEGLNQRLERMFALDFSSLERSAASLEATFRVLSNRIETLVSVGVAGFGELQRATGWFQELFEFRSGFFDLVTGFGQAKRGVETFVKSLGIVDNVTDVFKGTREEVEKLRDELLATTQKNRYAAITKEIDDRMQSIIDNAKRVKDAGDDALDGMIEDANQEIKTKFKPQILSPEAFQNKLFVSDSESKLEIATNANTTAVANNILATQALARQSSATQQTLSQLQQALDSILEGNAVQVEMVG